MRNRTISRGHSRAAGSLAAIGVAAASLAVTGCGVQLADIAKSTPAAVAGTAMAGRVFGGQQPISGATIQLYAASTGGYGAASYALLNAAVTTDSGGNFNITGDYTCPSATSLVYLTATGGNPGAGTNTAAAEMAALGACGNLTATTQIIMNEVTTVASVYALAPFMTGYANIGTSSTNTQGLTNAFATVNRLASFSTGSASSAALPAGATTPVAAINTLGNIIASCINTSGSSSTQCATLFSKAVSSSGTQPTDTIGALLNIARNPGQNVSALFALNSAVAPFQPSSTSMSDFTLTIKYKPSLSTPSASAVAANGDVWVTSAGNNTLSIVSGSTGAATVISPGIYLATPSGIAFDQSGNAWISNRTNYANTSGISQVTVLNSSGVGQNGAFVSGSLSGVAINGAGQVATSNSSNSSIVLFTPSGTSLGTQSTYTTGGVNAPNAIAINPF